MAYSNLEDIAEARITDRTIRKMYGFIDAAKTDEKFQKLVYSVLNTRMRGEWKQYRREAEVLLQWVKQAVDYRRDPVNVELVQDVWATLDRKRADCDDFVVLLGGALETTGTPVRIVTCSTRPDKQPSHVYLEAYLDGRWEPMDAIIQWSTVGWRPTDGVTDKKVWTRKDLGLSGYEENPDMSGLGDFLGRLFAPFTKPATPDFTYSANHPVTGRKAPKWHKFVTTPGKFYGKLVPEHFHLHPPLSGLGMHDSMPDGWTDDRYNTGRDRAWEGGFADRMFVVPLPGVPNNISETFAPGMPGDAIIAGRIAEPSKLVNSVSDDRVTFRADDPTIPYPMKLPIESFRDPVAMDYTAPRSRIPMRFNPDAWTGKAEDWTLAPSYMMPQQTVPLEDKLMDIAGLGRYGRNNSYITPSWDDYTMAGYGGGMGSFFDDLVAKAKALVEGGIATVQGAAAMVTGGAKPPAPAATPPPAGGMPGWVIPVGVVGVIALIGYTMMGRGGRARRNPRRGMNLKKLALPAAVAVGAWVVLSKKNGVKPAAAGVNPTSSPDYTAASKVVSPSGMAIVSSV